MGNGSGCSCEMGTVFLPSLIGGAYFGHLVVTAEGLSNQLARNSDNLLNRRELRSSRPILQITVVSPYNTSLKCHPLDCLQCQGASLLPKTVVPPNYGQLR